jgi:nitroreductase
MSHPKIARTDYEILDVIRQRWSPRAFDPSREVARADLLKLFEAARWAPSAGNEQPWGFVLAERRRSPATFAALLASLTGRNPEWAGAASAFVLAAVRSTVEGRGPVSRLAWYDAGQAVGFLTLQATALGISIRQMEGFDLDQARAACGVPAAFEPAVIMAVGYAGDPDALPTEKHRAAERQPRERRPVGDFAYEERWGRGFSDER